MQDSFGRKIEYLRVSVTDKCNLRCRYCMPQEGITRLAHDDILRLEEWARIIPNHAGAWHHQGTLYRG